MKPAYLNLVLGVAMLLLLAPAGAFAQEGYYGAPETIALGAEPPLPVLAAQNDTYSGGGDGYYGAQQPSDTCVQSQQVMVAKMANLILVRGTETGSATSPFADQDTGLSTCVGPRSNSVRALPDGSAPQNQVEYGGAGM